MQKFSITIALLTAASLPAQNLDTYLQLALENNPGIKAQNTEVQAALQKIPQVGALPDPQVDASFFISPMMLPMGNQLGSISAMQMFPWFGTREAMRNEAAQMAQVKQQAIRVTENELRFRVKSAWYPLLELEAQLKVQREKLRVLETDKELATFKFQHGQAPMADAIRADIMIDEVKTEIELLEQKRQPLVAVFNLVLNRAADTPLPVSERLPEPAATAEARPADPVAGNPALAVFDQQIRAAEAEQQVAETMRKPMISAGLQYMPLVKRKSHDIHIEPNTGRDMIMPMVSVTIPIWRKKYDAAVEERRLMQLAYTDMKQGMQNELGAMYEMTRYEMGKATRMIELLNMQMNKTQQVVDLLLAAYRNDGQDFEEILRLQQQLFRYQSEKISAQTEYQLALVQLDYLTGK